MSNQKNDRLISLIGELPLFEDLARSDSAKLGEIIAQSETRRFERGEVIIEEGDAGHGMFVLLDGSIQIYTRTDDGADAILDAMQPVSCFGEQSLMPGSSGSRNASVRATLPTELLYIPADLFRRYVLSDDRQVRYLQSVGAEHVRNKFVQQSSLFRALSLQDKTADWLHHEYYRDGEIIFRQGDSGDKFYIVVSGQARAIERVRGEEKTAALLGPGRYFGELALIRSEPRTATLTAEGDLHLLSLQLEAFYRLYDANPELQEQMEHLRGVYQLSVKAVMTLHEGSFLDEKSVTAMYHFPSGIEVSSTKVVGKPVFRMNRLDVDESALKRISYTLSKEGIAREIQLLGNQLVAVTAFGNWPDLGRVHQLILHSGRIAPWQLASFRLNGELWLEEEKADFADTAIVCKCASVTRSTLNEAVAAGCCSVEELGQHTGACQVCGSCAPLLAEIVGQSDMEPADLLEVLPVTEEIKSFRFRPRSVQAAASLPGQHFRIETRIGGRWVQRSYTLTSPARQNDYYEITVKREPNGLFSRWLHDRLTENSLVRISQPQGTYYLPPEHRGPVVCYAGGIGITPALAMLRSLTGQDDTRPVYVDYSARARGQLAYVNEWEQAMHAHENVRINFRVKGEQPRVQPEEVQKTADAYPGAHFFLCGPESFQNAVAGHILQAKVPEERIHVEHFVPPGGNEPAIPSLKFGYTLLLAAFLILPLSLWLPLASAWQPRAFWSGEAGLQPTGYAMLALLAISLGMSLRKRKAILIGDFAHWRLLHVLLGLALLALLALHTGFEWGARLPRFLLLSVLAALGAGSLAAISLWLENRLAGNWTRGVRRGLYWAHVVTAWPIPVLLALHLVSVYYF